MSAAKKKNKSAGTKPVRSSFGVLDMFSRPYNYLFGSTATNNNIIYWGENNDLPEYIFEQYCKNSYFGPIINKMVDFIIGGGIEPSEELEKYIRTQMAQDVKVGVNTRNKYEKTRREMAVNVECDTLQDVLKPAIKDYLLFGTPAFDMYFSRFGTLSEIYYQDVIKNRLIKGRSAVRHEKSGWTSGGDKEDIPLFEAWKTSPTRCVYMHYNKADRTVYPLPYYYSGLGAIKVGSKITEYNETSLDDGFAPNIAVSLPGTMTDEEMEKIADETRKRYSGSKGLKIFWIRNDGSGENAAVNAIPQENVGERFSALYDINEKQIYATLDAPKQLYGNQADAGVFNDQSYFQVLQLHYDSKIYPFRDDIISMGEYIFGMEKPFKFKPSVLEKRLMNMGQVNSTTENTDERVELTTDNMKYDDVNNIPTEFLNDLSVNERRQLIGYPELQDKDAEQTILADRLGVGGTQSLVDVVQNESLSPETKRGILSVLFGLSVDQINNILYNN